MIRICIVGSLLLLAIAAPATAQPRCVPVPQILERLHTLCDQDYKPAYVLSLGLLSEAFHQVSLENYEKIIRNGGGGSGELICERFNTRKSFSFVT